MTLLSAVVAVALTLLVLPAAGQTPPSAEPERLLRRRTPSRRSPSRRVLSRSPSPARARPRREEVADRLRALAGEHADRATIVPVGFSVSGREILAADRAVGGRSGGPRSSWPASTAVASRTPDAALQLAERPAPAPTPTRPRARPRPAS
jgi:hypothetical protein